MNENGNGPQAPETPVENTNENQNPAPQENNEVSELLGLIEEDGGAEIPEEPVNPDPVPEGGEAPESTETPETPETPTEEDPDAPAFDWSQFVPDQSAVPPAPTPDENGQVDFEELSKHLVEKAKAEIRSEERLRTELDRQFTEAEKVLPQIKKNPRLAAMVRDSAIVAAEQGAPLDIIGAAKVLAEEFGLERSQAQADARVVITEEERAAVGGGQSTAPDARATKIKQLEQRVNLGDRDAIEEVVDMWLEEGVI